MKLNKVADLYLKPLENTLKNTWKFTKKSWKYHGILSVRKVGTLLCIILSTGLGVYPSMHLSGGCVWTGSLWTGVCEQEGLHPAHPPPRIHFCFYFEFHVFPEIDCIILILEIMLETSEDSKFSSRLNLLLESFHTQIVRLILKSSLRCYKKILHFSLLDVAFQWIFVHLSGIGMWH